MFILRDLLVRAIAGIAVHQLELGAVFRNGRSAGPRQWEMLPCLVFVLGTLKDELVSV